MTAPRRFPFRGVPVYNPQSLSREEAVAQFHARQGIYRSLLDLLGEDRPSHVLIIGTRGMGKTTLLQRLRFGVEETPELAERYLPICFPEEQYNVNHLHHFLLNAVDALADALEQRGDLKMLARVEAFMELWGKSPSAEILDKAPVFLAEVGADLKRSFLLLVDNADRLFETIESREQWRFRELLSNNDGLTFFGATTQASEGIYAHDRAFFEFFRIERLAPLTLEEVKSLLLKLSDVVDEKDGGSARRRVEDWLNADPARLRTLVQLTGGNPRTAVLLFHLVLDGLEGGAREYLEQLLDQCTPTYKGRVDDLPPQAQQVLDALALKWDPATAGEIAEDTGLETGTVSTHLTRLLRQGLLEKVDPGDSKKALYQVAERFFNIWYLMRASRRVRTRLRWFVEFLRVFYDSGELEGIAKEKLDRFRSLSQAGQHEIESLFAYACAAGAEAKFAEYLRRECAERLSEWGPYFMSSEVKDGNPDSEGLELNLRMAVEALRSLLAATANAPDEYQRARAIQNQIASDPDLVSSLEAVARTSISRFPGMVVAQRVLAYLLCGFTTRTKEAEEELRGAIALDTRDPYSWGYLGTLLARKSESREHEAELALRQAAELDPTRSTWWTALGSLLARQSGREVEAEAALIKAIELNPAEAEAFGYLAELLRRMPGRESEAELTLRRAIELNPNEPIDVVRLGTALARFPRRRQEAETLLRGVLERDPECTPAWMGLGAVLFGQTNREQESEQAYRKTIELDPTAAGAWSSLGSLLCLRFPERMEEGQAAIRKAIELEPLSPDFRIALAFAVETADAFEEAMRLSPDHAELLGRYGVFLACKSDDPDNAEASFRKSLQIDFRTQVLRNLGVLLICEQRKENEGLDCLMRASIPDINDSTSPEVAQALYLANLNTDRTDTGQIEALAGSARNMTFWNELSGLCETYPPFGKILLRLCDLIEKHSADNPYAPLYRALAIAQLNDFPRAIVALGDALTGDPIDLLSWGRRPLEIILGAAVRNRRVRDCLELIKKKDWIDAWRPIYEALRAVEAGTGNHLKRVAVEIQGPAYAILRRIAPKLPGLNP